MAWIFKNDRPIYVQIVERIQLSILSGEYKLGEKLPSVRELAAVAAVNPNTMQKAMVELERLGMVHAERTSGRFITSDVEMIDKLKKQLAKEYISEFVVKMKKIGYNENDIIEMMEE